MELDNVSGAESAVETKETETPDVIIEGYETEPKEQPKEEVKEPIDSEPEEEGEPDEDDSKEEKQERKSKKGGFTRKLEKYEQELAELKAKLADKEKVAETVDEDKEPVDTDFEDYGEYIKAVAKWTVKQESKQLNERSQAEKAQEELKQKAGAYTAKAAELAQSIPDYEEVTENSDIVVTPLLRAALLDSDMGPEVAYYLAKNPDEGHKTEKMGVVELNKFIGRIEAKLEMQKQPVVQRKASKAPEPIKPLGSGKAKTPSLDDPDLPYEDYVALRQKR